MKKRISIILLVLCTVFAAFTVTVLTATAETPTTPTGTALTRSNIGSYTTLTGGTSEDTRAYFYLSENMETTVTISVKGYVTLDLNGYMLKYSGTSDGSVIAVGNSGAAKFTMKDSRWNDNTAVHYFTKDTTTGLYTKSNDATSISVKGGIVTGGKAEKGGGVHVYKDSIFTMDGGTLVGCTATRGGGLSVRGICYLGGNSNIVGCTASQQGGGVYVEGIFLMKDNSTISECMAPAPSGPTIYVNASTPDNPMEDVCFHANGGHVYGDVHVASMAIFQNTSASFATVFYGKLTGRNVSNCLVRFFDGDTQYAWELVGKTTQAAAPPPPEKERLDVQRLVQRQKLRNVSLQF